MKAVKRRALAMIVVVSLLASVFCSGCGMSLHPIYKATLAGALIGGIIGYQSDEALAGALIGGAILGVGELDGYCMWGFSPGSYLALREMVGGDSAAITSNAVFQSLGLPVGEPLDAVAFVSLEEVGRRAEGLLAVLALVSKSVRKRSVKYGKIVAVAKLLRGVGCYVRHTEQDWTIVLRVPTQ